MNHENVLKEISNRSLASRLNGLVKTAEQRREYFWNVLFNCVAQCYKHNDVSWVNKGLAMARAVGRYKATLAILKQVTPFKYDSKTDQFGGKRKQGMFDELQSKFGTVLCALVDAQLASDSAPKVAKDYDFGKALENFMQKADANDYSENDVVEAIRDRSKLSLAA